MVILGASFDTPEDNAAFKRKFDFPFPLLCDEDRQLGLAFGACDQADAPAAKRITAVIGPDGKVQRMYRNVDAKSHPQQVLQDLSA